jgi:hypothetical protein
MSKEEQKFGNHSPLSDEMIREAFGSDAHQTAYVTRTAQGRYLYGRRRQAQLTTQVSEVKAVNVLQEVFGLERATPGLDVLCRSLPMGKLTQRIYVASQSTAHRKVAKGQEPALNLQSYLAVDMELWLNASHVAQFYEDQLEAAVPIMSISVDDAAGALRYARDLDIATELANATEIATGHDWGEMTTVPNSDHNPLIDIAGAMATLTSGGSGNASVMADPRIIAMHPDCWVDFITNSWITKFLAPSPVGQVGIPGPSQLRLTAYPNLTFIVNGTITPATSAFIVDPRHFILGQGPTQSVGYTNDLKRVEGHVLYEYLQPKLVTDQSETYTIGVRELTGVHA